MSETIDQDFTALKLTGDTTSLENYFDSCMGQGNSEHQDLNKVGDFLLDYKYGDKVVDVIEELEMEAPELDRYEFTLHDWTGKETRESLYLIDDGDTQVLAGSDKGARTYSKFTSDTQFGQHHDEDEEITASVLASYESKPIVDLPDREYFSSQEFKDDLKNVGRDLAYTIFT